MKRTLAKGEYGVISKDCSIEDLKEFAKGVVRSAGEMSLTYYGKGRADVKFDERLVTEAELRLTDYFREELNTRFPDHRVFMGVSTR